MIDLIKKKLDAYKVSNPLEEENALKEIVQENENEKSGRRTSGYQ